MKISILASILAVTSVGQLAVAAEHKSLRGDRRDLGIADWFADYFKGEGDKPELPILGDGDSDFPDIDFANMDFGDFDINDMMQRLEGLKEMLPALIQMIDMMEGLFPLLGGSIDVADLGCKTVSCASEECPEGSMLAQLFGGGEQMQCAKLQYIVAVDGEKRQRCVPEMMAGFLVNGLKRYECSTEGSTSTTEAPTRS